MTEYIGWLCAGALACILIVVYWRYMTKKSKKLETFGDYPPQLLRFFKERAHAEQFMAGSVRFGLLDYYKEVEDEARKDAAEGAGSFTAPAESVTTIKVDKNGDTISVDEAPGDVHHQVDFGNPTYIVSCSDPRKAAVEKLREKFGPHVVRITDPVRLGQDITDKIAEYDNTHPLAGSVVECAEVTYDKGQRRKVEQDKWEVLRTAYAQKPAEFSEEYEYRLVVFRRHLVNRDKSERNAVVELDGPLDYVELLSDGT